MTVPRRGKSALHPHYRAEMTLDGSTYVRCHVTADRYQARYIARTAARYTQATRVVDVRSGEVIFTRVGDQETASPVFTEWRKEAENGR